MSRKLIVSIFKGENIKSGKSLFGKSDPYVLVSIGDDKIERTRVHPKGGTDPVFNQDLVFDITGDEPQITITVYDKETTGTDRFMGEYTAPMSQILKDGIKDYVVLTDPKNYGSKEEGKLYLATKFILPDNYSNQVQQKFTGKLTITILKGENYYHYHYYYYYYYHYHYRYHFYCYYHYHYHYHQP